jgi:hypothetical protein
MQLIAAHKLRIWHGNSRPVANSNYVGPSSRRTKYRTPLISLGCLQNEVQKDRSEREHDG